MARADESLPEAPGGHHIMVDGSLAYLSMAPAGRPGGPAVIVIPGDLGLDGDLRRTADRMAAAGLTALVVDLYQGALPTTDEDARTRMQALDRRVAVDHIRQAARLLRTRQGVDAGKVGIIGGGAGGELALRAALATSDFSAVVTYDFPADDTTMQRLQAPLLALAGVPRDDADAANAAWTKTMAFFDAHLGVTMPRQSTSTWSAPFGVQGASQDERQRAATAQRENRGE